MTWRHPLNDVAGYDEVFAIHKQINALEENLATTRGKLAGGAVKNYDLVGSAGKRIKLASLFGKKDALVLIHNVGASCPYCTMWADGFNGAHKHLAKQAAFVVVNHDTPAAQKKAAKARGWTFPMASAKGSTMFRDLGFEDGQGHLYPGTSTFLKAKDGTIRRHASAPFGPGDKFCSVWSFFDLLPAGHRPG
jgi:predicted dithiol-disulfide oxidoreductase (DUF899 family)